MKKIVYQAPETKVIELKNKVSLLAGSGTGSEGPGGSGLDD